MSLFGMSLEGMIGRFQGTYVVWGVTTVSLISDVTELCAAESAGPESPVERMSGAKLRASKA